MQLPKLALKNSQFVLTIVVLLIFVAVRSFLSMPRSEDPFLSLPNYAIVVVYPGASPLDMEELIVDPIEEEIDEIDDITKIQTEIANSLAIIQVEAEFGIDYDDKYDEIESAINRLESTLPEGIIELEVSQFKPEDRVVVSQYAISSPTAPYYVLTDYAESFQDVLEQSAFVKNVEVEATLEEEVHILLDFQKMANLNIQLKQIIGVLQSNNIVIPGGAIKSDDLSFNINTSGNFESLEEIRNTAIAAFEGNIIYLRDIAEVNRSYEDQRWIARHNQEPAVFVTVTQKRGGNIILLAEELNGYAEAFKAELPVDIKLSVAFEQAPAVASRIDDFINNLLQGILLVGAIIFFFLGFRPSLVIMTVIPLSILMAVGALDFSGFALQQISIAALVIALGLLVDNGIVVVENIIRYKREGLSNWEAASKGTGEVGYAIISSTVTTVLAFAPLAMLDSGPGEFLRTLPLTVIYVLTASLLLALIFTPIIARVSLGKKNKEPFILRYLNAFIDKVYAPVLRFSLRRGWVFLGLGIGLLLGSLSLFPQIGISFFPTADKPLLLVSVDHPYSSNIDHTDKTLRYIESVLDTIDFVDNYTVNAGHGNPQVYYNRIPESYKSYHGEVLINFKEWDKARFYRTLQTLRDEFVQYPDARITFSELKNGAPFNAPIEIILLGEDPEVLKEIAADVEQIIDQAEGTLDVENPLAIAKTDIDMAINRDKASLLNISLLSIDQSLRAIYSGLFIDNINLGIDNEEFPLTLRMTKEEDTKLANLRKSYVTNATGDHIPLSQVITPRFDQDYAKLNHYNTIRSTAITANVDDPDNTKAITEAFLPQLENYDWPMGYSYRIGGELETQSESFGDLSILLIVSMIGIFAVLVLQFKSIAQPLIIFSAIPLAISGSFIALYLTGWSFSFFAFVGFISLIGIVVNNSIILVDYTNQLIAKGEEKLQAIQIAAKRRFTPIVLTTLTTILGLLPLTVSGTSLWSPLGWTLIGGMISSSILTLLIVPVFYKWFSRS